MSRSDPARDAEHAEGGGRGAGRGAGAGASGKPDKPGKPGKGERRPETRTYEQKIDDIHERLVARRTTELTGLMELISSRRRLMWLNFNAGMARGVGFFLGVTLIGALVLGGVALAFNLTAKALGYTDITLEEAVTSTVRKFSEIKHLVAEAETEIRREETKQRAQAVGTEPAPDSIEAQLPGPGGKSFK